MSKGEAKGSSAHLEVRKNVLWNILGIGLPGLVAVFFIPRLITGMGIDRFGVLTLVLTFLNYFGLFDLGVGRALTQLLAGRFGENKRDESTLIWTVSGLLVLFGIGAGLLFYVTAPYITTHLLHIKGPLAVETLSALRSVAFVIPFLLHGLALKGILEANRRFDLSNMVRIPVVAFTFAAPFAVLPFSHDLRIIVPVMLLGRVLAWVLNLWMVFRILPQVWSLRGWDASHIGTVVFMGGWFTVSGIVAPIMDGLDRFFITSFLTISMVAYYTTPYELVLKLGIISGGVGGAIFPEFAHRFRQNRHEARPLFMRGFKYLLAILFPFVLIATAYAHEGLSWWLNPHFADLSTPVLQWLALFVFIIAAALVPMLCLAGAGRQDLVAKMHLIELPIHAGLLYVFVKFYGIRGAAIACVIRISIDFIAMLYFTGKLLGFVKTTYLRVLVPMLGGAAILLAFHFPIPALPKAILTALVLVGYAVAVWFVILEAPDKATALKILAPFRVSNRATIGR